MPSQIGFIRSSLIDPITTSQGYKIFYFCLPFFTKGHTNKKSASLADICITHQFKLFCEIPLILLYCEHLQYFAKEIHFLLHASTKVQIGIQIVKNNSSLTVFINITSTVYTLQVITFSNNNESYIKGIIFVGQKLSSKAYLALVSNFLKINVL